MCPKCKSKRSHKCGLTSAKSQRFRCVDCKKVFTPETKRYSEETKQLAMKVYYSGVSGCGVGKIFDMSHQNIYRWIKKNQSSVDI